MLIQPGDHGKGFVEGLVEVAFGLVYDSSGIDVES
jgi:hypothetical protein